MVKHLINGEQPFALYLNIYHMDVPSQAAMGIAHLLVMALEKEGVPKAEATRKIWMVDSKGLIVKVLSVWKPRGFLTPTAIGTGL